MRTKLIQIEQRIAELEKMAREIEASARKFYSSTKHKGVQPQLSIKGQTWYLAAHGLIEELYREKVEWLEYRYSGSSGMHSFLNTMEHEWIEQSDYNSFKGSFAEARGLLLGSLERVKSLELDTLIQLSSALVSDEFETAGQLFDAANGDESILRAAGTVARVALERHLHTRM
jgi:hypothetical protein